MSARKQRSAAANMLGAVALSLLLATPAAAGDQTSVTVTGGSLSMTTPAVTNFAAKTMTGVAQTTTAELAPFTVSDLRGLGAGWSVNAQASQFSGAAASLALGSLSMSEPEVASPDTTSADPQVAPGPYVIDGGGVVIARAEADTGMGRYDFTGTRLTLSLPADVHPDTYSSIVTISIQTGP